jgi:START domain
LDEKFPRLSPPKHHSRKSAAASYSADNNSLASVDSANKHLRRPKGWFGRNSGNQSNASISEVPNVIGVDLDDDLPAFETILDNSEPNAGLATSAYSALRVEESKPMERTLSFDLTQQDSVAKRRPSTPISTPMKQALTRTSSISKHDEKQAAELDKLHTTYISTLLRRRKKARKQVIEGTKIAAAATAAIGVGVMTAGVGIAAGLIVLGATAAAGGTAGVAEAGFKRRKAAATKLVFATSNYEEARLWKASLEACLDFEVVAHSTWGQLFIAEGRNTRSALLPSDVELLTKSSQDGGGPKRDDGFLSRNFSQQDLPESQNDLFLKNRAFLVEANTRWRSLEGGWTSLLGSGSQGLRIFREEKESSNLAVGGTTCAPLKAKVVLNAHPLDAFLCLMSFARIVPSHLHSDGRMVPNSGQRASFRLIEHIDDHTDVVHWICQPLYLFPSWTAPRDFVLFRYWRYEPDGSYIICYESILHADCPPRPDFVRGEMHQVCTLAPTKNHEKPRSSTLGTSAPECLLTSVVQVDPKGWIPVKPLSFLSNQGYADAFGVAGLLQLLDARDAIDHDRFLNVAADTHYIPPNPHMARPRAIITWEIMLVSCRTN